MARPERRNADYFPFYCKDGKTLFILENAYDCRGTGFFTNVMRFLTLQDDHHFCIAEAADQLYFFSKCKCDPEAGMDMLDIMAKTGKIDRCLWETKRVIASQDHLDSISHAYRNRINPIITIDDIKSLYGISCINDVSDEETIVSDVGNSQEPVVSDTKKPQTKLNKTKLNYNNNSGQSSVRNPKKSAGNSKSSDFFRNPYHPYFESINDRCLTILKFPDQKGFNPCEFVNMHLNKRKGHPGAVDNVLGSMVVNWETIDAPWKYSTKAMVIQNKNFYEKDYIDDHKKVKQAFSAFLDNNPELKKLMEEIAK